MGWVAKILKLMGEQSSHFKIGKGIEVLLMKCIFLKQKSIIFKTFHLQWAIILFFMDKLFTTGPNFNIVFHLRQAEIDIIGEENFSTNLNICWWDRKFFRLKGRGIDFGF